MSARVYPQVTTEVQQIQDLLQEKIIPWVQLGGMANVFTAYSSWQALKRADPDLPHGAAVTHKPLQGKRVRGRNLRTHGNMNVEEFRWPKDKLLSARVPKLCFVTEGPVAFQIADYVLHCSPGHGILLPPGTPNPDGSLSILDASRQNHGTCEILMILPRQGSLSCWTTHHTIDVRGKMTRWSDTFSISQSLVPSCLHQLMNEAVRRQLHWEDICTHLLHTLFLLLHRELKELPVIRGGNDSVGELFESSRPEMHPITKAEEYIRANLRWPLTIDQVARTVYLSRTTFIEQFRIRTGKSFIEYVNDCRFEEACRLLKGSDLSIKRVSLQIGITPRSLRLLCCKRTGCSPITLRRQYRNAK
jgi:AraC-like DNA-binding protein